MLVCHCRAVNDRQVREEIAAGARDEFDIAARCGAGAGCGGCVPVISELLAECGRGADSMAAALGPMLDESDGVVDGRERRS